MVSYGTTTPQSISGPNYVHAKGNRSPTTVSAWIAGIQMRRKIKRDLGRKATDADLTSIDTWMKVDEVEQRNGRTKPPNIG
jgi:hypothetical protein